MRRAAVHRLFRPGGGSLAGRVATLARRDNGGGIVSRYASARLLVGFLEVAPITRGDVMLILSVTGSANTGTAPIQSRPFPSLLTELT